jgi:DNA sulfur modification protein DndB
MVIMSQDLSATIPGSGYNQFGKEILVTQMSFYMLEAIFKVDPEVQRKLDPQRRSEIRDFILKSVEKDDFYFSPFVFSARGAITQQDKGWTLNPGCKLYILDGMHRSAGLSSAISHLKSKKESAEEANRMDLAEKYQSYLDKIRSYPVSMQIYLNLNMQEERQLFTDINTERREAHVGVIMQYDQRDIYTKLIRNISKQLSEKFEIEQKLSRMSIQSSALTSLSIMRKCVLALFEGDLVAKWSESSNLYHHPDEMEEVAMAFFETWPKIFPKQSTDRKLYVSGITGIQIALAYTVNQLVHTHQITQQDAIKELVSLKKNCTWKHTDPLFSHLYDPLSRQIKSHSRINSIKHTASEFLNIIVKRGL